MIIGIIGYKGVGKDTVGNYLVEQGYVKLSFADSLKDVVAGIFGWDRELLSGSTHTSRTWREEPDLWWNEQLDWESKYGRVLTPRHVLQIIGTDVMRNNFFDTIWIKSLERKLKNWDNVVITDCRFQNELELITRHQGKVIRIVRGEKPEWEDLAINTPELMPIQYPNVHQSEWDWLDSHYDAVYNNSTLVDLYNQIDELNLT
jgi:hypothetical protein